MTTIDIPARADIDARFKWNVEKLYATDEAWQEDFARAERLVAEGAAYQGRLGEGAQTMLNFLAWSETSGLLMERLHLYAAMRRDEDNGNAHYQAMLDQMRGLEVQANCATAFFAPEVLALPEQLLAGYLAREEFALYRRLFEDITRMREHTLSPAEERLLAGTAEMAGAFHNIFTLFTNADLTLPAISNERGEEERLSAGNFVRFLRSPEREVRRAAFAAMYETYAAYGNTLAAVYAASVKKDNFYAETARFGSALSASLFGDNVEEAVYRNLISVVRAHLGDFHRYLEKRREILGLDELHMYDVYVPLFPELKRSFDWEQGKELVLVGLAPLGDIYTDTLRAGLASGWADVYENKGKTSGAYSTGFYQSDPYILLNYQNDINGVFTLAHEAGHSMHSYYSHKSQPYVYADYRIFVAEVASTVNENLLIDYLLRHAESREETQYLTNHYLEEFRTTVIRQTMFAEFELLAHEAAQRGEALTAERLCAVYYQLNKEYFGPNMAVDELIAWEWARIPHFYRAFYVYKYATGFCAASALSQGLLADDEVRRILSRQRYLRFLSGGSSKDPLDLLSDAGVDMRRPEAIEQGFRLFASMLEELA